MNVYKAAAKDTCVDVVVLHMTLKDNERHKTFIGSQYVPVLSKTMLILNVEHGVKLKMIPDNCNRSILKTFNLESTRYFS